MSVTNPGKIIAPSILSADFSKLGEEIVDVERAGCDWIHVDVMDGRFVPNLTIGAPVVRSIRKVTQLPLDVHLMIDEPIRYVDDFRRAGSDLITIHVEACKNVSATLRKIRRVGARTGISIKPRTKLSTIRPYLEGLDLVLVMSVEPGFGGQQFMPGMMSKVAELRRVFSGYISVDGGINVKTARQAAQAGANVFVAGSSIFNVKDRRKIISDLRRAIA